MMAQSSNGSGHRALQQYQDAKFHAEVFYPTHTRVVGRGSLDQGFIRRLVALIQRVAAPEPPIRVPSASECRFCDITHDDSADRMDADPEVVEGNTEDF